MKSNKKPVVSLTAVTFTAVFAVLLFSTSLLSAPEKRPARGSVNFGASGSSGVNIPPAMQGFTTVFADVAEKVVPTVVSVIPTKIDTVIFTNNPFYQFFNDPFFGGNPFGDFFGGRPQQRQPPQQQQPPQPQTRRQQGLGSGVIVSKNGYILTNCHVVSGADEIEVKISDGRSFEAILVGADSLTDVAVLKIKDKVNNLPVAHLGDSDKLRPGDWAVAIGNPFSLTSSVTMGIVSAVGRTTPSSGQSGYQDFIQTDAAINPGNSGGALVNIQGELVGINTMIYTQSGGNMGIGFAIPINMARRIMEDLIFDGKVSRGWLGVSIQELDQSTRDAFGLSAETKGVLIGDVFKGQPADKAGIKRGDVITKVNDRSIETLNQLRNQVAAIHPGKTVPVEVLRNGKKHTMQVKVTARDESGTQVSSSDAIADQQQAQTSDAAQLIGVKVGAITNDLREQLNIAKNIQGVVITEITRGSQAAQEGLKPNDIILEVNRKQVPTVKDFTQSVKGMKAGDPILFLIQRDGNTFYRAFKIRK